MAAKQYQDYIRPLRTRPARPSFEEIARLVNGRGKEAAASTAFFMAWAVLLVLALVPAGYWLLKGDNLLRSAEHSAKAASYGSSLTIKISKGGHASSRTYTSYRTDTMPGPASTAINEDGGFSKGLAAVAPLPDNKLASAATLQPSFSLREGAAIQDTAHVSFHRFFVEAGGAVGFQVSSDPAYHLTSFGEPYIACGYDLSPNLSVGLVARLETFVVRENSYSTTFRDTTFVHDGTQYQNIIGNVVTTPVPQSKQIAYLGGSVRYSVRESRLAPFVEVMAGGSSEGLLAGGSLGVQAWQSGDLSIEVAASLRELFPSSGSPFTKAGIGAGLRWNF